jgi:NAD(P)H-hydrate epimerase
MYYATEKQMERLDILAVKYGLQICQMMELAGWHIIEVFKCLKVSKRAKVVVVVGKGNKGGDGLCAARHLINHGWQVSIVLVSKKMSEGALHQLELLEKMKADIVLYPRSRVKAVKLIKRSDVIIDSLIGYHLKGAPRGFFKELIELINSVCKKVIAYDIPSGLDSTTGKCLEPTIRAYTTLTLALPKQAFKTRSDRKMSGKIFLGDIGISDFLYDKIACNSRPRFNKGVNGILKL